MAHYAILDTSIGHSWSTPDAAALDLTDHIDLRVLLASPASWTPATAQNLMGKWTEAGNQLSYRFRLTSAGLQFQFTTAGAVGVTLNSAALPVLLTSQTAPVWVRVVFTSNVAGQSTADFYYSIDGAASWVLITHTANATPGPVFSGTSPLYVGYTAATTTSTGLDGHIYRAQVWDASGPTLVADFDVRFQTTVAAFAASTGETWTPAGSAALGADEYLSAADFGPSSIPIGALNMVGQDDGLTIQSFGAIAAMRRAVPYWRALDYGVLQDGQFVTNAAMTSGSHVITSPSSGFRTATVGQNVVMAGAGAAGANLITTITSVSSIPASITVADAASATVGPKTCLWATDDSAALNALLAELKTTVGQSHLTGQGGHIVLEQASIIGLASSLNIGALRSVHISGQGGVSDIEGDAFGTCFVTLTPGMTAINIDGGATVNQWGPQLQDFNIRDFAGGSRLIYGTITNRIRLQNMTLFGANIGFEQKADIGGPLLDSAWHKLDQVFFHNCATGWKATSGYGGTMEAGAFINCAVGYDGTKDHWNTLIRADFGLVQAGAIGIRSRGFGMKTIGVKMETANNSFDVTGFDLDGLTTGTTPTYGVLHNHVGAQLAFGSGAGQYGFKLGSLLRGGYFQGTMMAIPVANRFVDGGSNNDAWISGHDGYSLRQHAGLPEWTGTGSPEGVIPAPIGATYRRRDQSRRTAWYVKASGSGSTGWVKD